MRRSTTKSLVAALIGSAPVLLTSCDVTVDFWDYQSNVSVNIPVGMPLTISAQNTVNVFANQAIASKANLVTAIQIPDIWLEVSSVQPTNLATLASGSITITDPDPSDTTFTPITLSYTDLPIKAGGRVDLQPAQSDVNELQTLIQKTGKFHIEYSGNIDQEPALFGLQGAIHVVATVNVPL